MGLDEVAHARGGAVAAGDDGRSVREGMEHCVQAAPVIEEEERERRVCGPTHTELLEEECGIVHGGLGIARRAGREQDEPRMPPSPQLSIKLVGCGASGSLEAHAITFVDVDVRLHLRDLVLPLTAGTTGAALGDDDGCALDQGEEQRYCVGRELTLKTYHGPGSDPLPLEFALPVVPALEEFPVGAAGGRRYHRWLGGSFLEALDEEVGEHQNSTSTLP